MKETPNEQDIIELEEYAMAGKSVPETCKLFRIRIDREKYLVQQAALTGAELLHLADKDPDQYKVFFKCQGETTEIALDTHFSFLNPGVESFITEKIQKVTIIVEGTPHEWAEKKITYEQVVKLEVPGYNPNSGITYSVTYERGPRNKPEGILAPGASVKVKDGMVFNVSETGQS
jgi:hypothetical protein